MSVLSELTPAQRLLVPNLDAPEDRDQREVGALALLAVIKYAPNAPGPVQTMAASRTARWMLSQALDNVDKVSFGSDGGGTSGYQSQFRNVSQQALRGSGAMAILNPWRKRRARAAR